MLCDILDALRPLLARPLLGALVLAAVLVALGATIGAAIGWRIVRAAKRKAESIERGAQRLATEAVAAWEAMHGKRERRSTILPPR